MTGAGVAEQCRGGTEGHRTVVDQQTFSLETDGLRPGVPIVRARGRPGQPFYRFRDRKRWQEFLGFLRQLRARFPTGRLHVVCDNFSPHHKQQVRDWCADHDVELVFTPSNASWLNWIECEFTTLDGSDYPSHAAQEVAIAGYVRWANKRARPKPQFAIDSKIRRPDLLTQRCLTQH